MSTIAARMAITYPKEHGGWGIKVTSFNDARQVQEARPALLLVMGAASLVLLVPCANVAVLLLAHTTDPSRTGTVLACKTAPG